MPTPTDPTLAPTPAPLTSLLRTERHPSPSDRAGCLFQSSKGKRVAEGIRTPDPLDHNQVL